MIGFILAGALGVAALIVYLLFRRLRKLSWQLTEMRVERDSERILQQIGLRAASRSLDLKNPGDVPVRRKRHLALYLGGALSAALAKLRRVGHSHPQVAVTGGVVTTVAVGAAALLLTLGGGATGPHSFPTGTLPPGPTGPAMTSSAPTARGPSGEPPPASSSSGGTATGGGDQAISATGPIAIQSSTTQQPSGRSPTADPTESEPQDSSPPASTSGATEPSAPAPSTTAPGTDPVLGLCADVRMLLELHVCLGL